MVPECRFMATSRLSSRVPGMSVPPPRPDVGSTPANVSGCEGLSDACWSRWLRRLASAGRRRTSLRVGNRGGLRQGVAPCSVYRQAGLPKEDQRAGNDQPDGDERTYAGRVVVVNWDHTLRPSSRPLARFPAPSSGIEYKNTFGKA